MTERTLTGDEPNLPENPLTAMSGAGIEINVETTLEERIAALRANGIRLNPARQPGQRARYLLVVLVCWVVIGIGAYRFQTQPILGAALIFTTFVAAILWTNRQRVLLLARHSTAQYRLSAGTDGLTLASSNAESRLAWSSVQGIEVRGKATLVFLRGFQCLWLPHRCFASDAERHALVTMLESHSASPVQEAGLNEALAPASRISFVSALLGNLVTGVLLLCLRREAVRRLTPAVPQLAALVVLPIMISLTGDLVRVGFDGQFNTYALASALYGLPWLLLAAWAAARIAGNEQATLRAAIGVQSMWCWVALTAQAMSFLPESAWQAAGSAAIIFWWLPFAYAMFAALPALIRTTGLPAEQRVGALLIVVYLLALPLVIAPRNQPLWVALEAPSKTATAEQRERWEAPTREAILYSQPRLIAETLDRIKPGQPGKAELFLLAVGGHGNQDVFMREVKSVDRLFAERFGTRGHSAVLLNNPATLNEYPLASVTALEQTVQGMAQRMNRDEDVLFLFMTSHGGDDYRFDLSMWPFKFDDLTPQRLKAVLDKAGIRHRVVVVSSCYSGGFVPPLADANTWVMTAARADRNSHGCSHEADWTFFGRAFFDEALRGTRSFEQAFEIAKKSIAEREKNEELTPSEPQTGGGEAVKQVLTRITQGLK